LAQGWYGNCDYITSGFLLLRNKVNLINSINSGSSSNSSNQLNNVLQLRRAAVLQFKCVTAVLILTLCAMLYACPPQAGALRIVNGSTAQRQHGSTFLGVNDVKRNDPNTR